MAQLTKSVYSRNLWAIMSKFNVLPSDPAFQNLTDSHLAYIINNMLIDNKEAELVKKGIDPSTYTEDESFNWEGDLNLEEGEEAEQIVASAQALQQTILDKDRPGARVSEEERRQIEAIKEVQRRTKELEELGEEMDRTGAVSEEDHIFRNIERAGADPSTFSQDDDDFLNFRDVAVTPAEKGQVEEEPSQVSEEDLDELAMQEITKGFGMDDF